MNSATAAGGGSAVDNPDEVLVTEALARRPARPADFETENRVLCSLSRELASNPENLLQKLANATLLLCRAGSAGVSVVDTDTGQLRWHAVVGQLAGHAGCGAVPAASPCGTTIERNTPLLFSYPGRHYPFVAPMQPAVVEALLLPFHAGERPVGTLWAVAHTLERRFDAEDLRLLTALSRFASVSMEFASPQPKSAADCIEVERQVLRRTRELHHANEALKKRVHQLELANAELRVSQAQLQAELASAHKAYLRGPDRSRQWADSGFRA
jgi:hypothetical protein